MITNAEISLPETSTQAEALVSDLRGRRTGLLEAIEGAVTRRKANAALAALGNSAAQAELNRAASDAEQAQLALARLDEAVSAMEQHRDKLHQAERVAQAAADAERRERKINDALDLADRIDAGCEDLRELFELRRELLADPDLQAAGHFSLNSTRATGQALLSIFEKELWFVRERLRPEELVTVAEADGEAFGRSSPRSIARGPREPTITAKALMRAFERPLQPAVGGR